jgi:cytochrome c biogenesis protein CcmG, thiol:disulfide interchange protein DsbE
LSATTDRNTLDALRRTARWRFLVGSLLIGICFFSGLPNAIARDSLVNRKAPEFVRKDLSGARLDLKSFRGKVVLLNFWATWCAPCQVDMPVFATWQRQYGSDGFQAIAISMDDNAAPVRRLLPNLNLNYPVVMGDTKLGERYGVLGIPLTYLIDRNGVVRDRFQSETDLKTIEKQFMMLLAK